jgi:hypothetical protein
MEYVAAGDTPFAANIQIKYELYISKDTATLEPAEVLECWALFKTSLGIFHFDGLLQGHARRQRPNFNIADFEKGTVLVESGQRGTLECYAR